MSPPPTWIVKSELHFWMNFSLKDIKWLCHPWWPNLSSDLHICAALNHPNWQEVLNYPSVLLTQATRWTLFKCFAARGAVFRNACNPLKKFWLLVGRCTFTFTHLFLYWCIYFCLHLILVICLDFFLFPVKRHNVPAVISVRILVLSRRLVEVFPQDVFKPRWLWSLTSANVS